MPGLLFSGLLTLLASPAASTVDEPVAEAKAPSKGSGLPQLVRGGNAFRLRAPISLPLVGYRPLAQFDMAWLHAIEGPHWFTLSGAARFDYSRAPRVVGADSCEPECGRGAVYGGELALGYRFAPRFHRKPWLVSEAHAALSGGYWRYAPGLQIDRRHSGSVGLRVGGGLRIFLTSTLGVGADVDLQLDLLLHREQGLDAEFGLGLALLPAVLELRR